MKEENDARPRGDLSNRFDREMNLFVQATPESHIEGILGALSAYRNWLQQNIQTAGQISGQKFAAWMKSTTRDPLHYPEPWGADLIGRFDKIVIEAAEEQNMQPKQIIKELDLWVGRSKEKVKNIYGLPEGFFNVK